MAITEAKGEKIVNMSLPTEGALTNPVVLRGGIKVDPVRQRYSVFVGQNPSLGLHLSAVEQLPEHKKIRYADLTHEEREALLLYSLWTEDSVLAIEIAKKAGISERRMNQYVDTAKSEMEPFSDIMFDIVNDLRRKAEAAQSAGVKPTVTPEDAKATGSVTLYTKIQQDILNTETTNKPAKPQEQPDQVEAPSVVLQTIFVENDTGRSIDRHIAQSYDHPILGKWQELALFRYLRGSVAIEELRQDASFINSFEPEDRPKITRILEHSSTIEEVICSCYLRLVDVIARNYDQIPLEDAINTGNIGLIQSARRWDSERGAKFSTYAVWGIRSAIQKESYKQRSAIRLPEYVQQDLGKARWVREIFEDLFGRTPTIDELRQQLLANTDIPRWRLDIALKVFESRIDKVSSLNEKLTDDSEDERGDFVADKTVDVETTVVDTVDNEALKRKINLALKKHLTEEERHVILALYGLGESGEKTVEELSFVTGRTRGDVEDIEKRSLGKLRYDKWLREHWQEDPPSFIYTNSAERAAFRLGLFDEDATSEPAESLVHQAEHSAQSQGVQSVIKNREGVIFDPAQQPQISVEPQTISLAVPIVKPLSSPNTDERKPGTIIDKVKQLRNQGYDNQEIAAMLQVSYGVVAQAAIRLLKKGEITSLKTKGRVKKEEEDRVASVSEDTELVRKYIEEHPRPSYKDGFRRIFESSRKPGGKKPETIEFERRVKELREQGLTHKQIAEKLGTSWYRVQAAAYNLVRAGELSKRTSIPNPKERAAKIADAKQFKERVIELSLQGLNSIQIAETLEDSVSRVRFIMWSLQKEKKVRLAPEQLRPANITGYVDKHANTPTGELYDKIATMRKQGMSNGEIASALDLSKHQVETRASNLIRAGVIQPGPVSKIPYQVGVVDPDAEVPKGGNFDKVAELRKQGLNNVQIARTLAISLNVVTQIASKLIRAGMIQPLKVTGKERDQIRAKIKELENQGVGGAEIARRLNQPKDRIYSMIKQLIVDGELNK